MKHASHPDIIRRLKQANGQIASVIRMFEDAESVRQALNEFKSLSKYL